jgi:hypothetical protein
LKAQPSSEENALPQLAGVAVVDPSTDRIAVGDWTMPPVQFGIAVASLTGFLLLSLESQAVRTECTVHTYQGVYTTECLWPLKGSGVQGWPIILTVMTRDAPEDQLTASTKSRSLGSAWHSKLFQFTASVLYIDIHKAVLRSTRLC